LDGGPFYNRRSDWDAARIKSSWDESNHNWCHLGYRELCDSCLRAYGLDSDWDRLDDHICYLGVENNNNSMGETHMIGTISSLLGTTWWTVVCFAAGFAAGLVLKSWIMNRLR